MSEETDVSNISNTDEDVTPEVTEETVDSLETTNESVPQEETQEDDVDAVRDRLAKAEELARNYKLRAEKAEKKSKEVVKSPQVSHDLTSKDMIALMNAKIHEDDIDEVVEYARFKKVSIADAIKSSVIKASLAERSEFRQTAQATSTGRTRTATQRTSPDVLLAKAQKTGELPDNPSDLDALLEKRYTR